MNHLVIDLEMCKVPRDFRNKEYHYASEIIQIGAILLDEEYQKIGTLSQYVHPEYGVIDPFIENLTGINNSQVKHAPVLQDVMTHLIDWLGDCEYKVYAWSDADYNQFMHEVLSKGLEGEKIESFVDPERWIDYQEVFMKRYEMERYVGLEEALNRAEIMPEGRLHDGLDDAINTAHLIEKLENNPEYQILCYEPKDKKTETLVFSLGDLFAGIQIENAG